MLLLSCRKRIQDPVRYHDHHISGFQLSGFLFTLLSLDYPQRKTFRTDMLHPVFSPQKCHCRSCFYKLTFSIIEIKNAHINRRKANLFPSHNKSRIDHGKCSFHRKSCSKKLFQHFYQHPAFL